MFMAPLATYRIECQSLRKVSGPNRKVTLTKYTCTQIYFEIGVVCVYKCVFSCAKISFTFKTVHYSAFVLSKQSCAQSEMRSQNIFTLLHFKIISSHFKKTNLFICKLKLICILQCTKKKAFIMFQYQHHMPNVYSQNKNIGLL